MGGLGNQLFQYAFGRRLALANEADLWLDAGGYGQPRQPDLAKGERTLELGNFNVDARIVTGGASAVGGDLLQRRVLKLLRTARRLAESARPYYQRHEVVEPVQNSFRFDPNVANLRFRGNLSLRGFWQSERYFVDIEPVLRKELTLCVPIPDDAQDLASQLRGTSSVAVHVRHTDNANAIAARLGVLPRRYYDTAMTSLALDVPDAQFYVFSDDIGWAEQFLGTGAPITYVSTVGGGKASIDLYLMACCRHHITANSTFSWWGAWLGNRQGQIVYAPARYYQDADQPNPDFYPPSWRLLES